MCVTPQVQGLRAAYEDVTLRLPAAGSPAAIFARAESFVRLEAELPSGPDSVSPGSVWPIVQSWELEELTYRVVSSVRLVLDTSRSHAMQYWLWVSPHRIKYGACPTASNVHGRSQGSL